MGEGVVEGVCVCDVDCCDATGSESSANAVNEAENFFIVIVDITDTLTTFDFNPPCERRQTGIFSFKDTCRLQN